MVSKITLHMTFLRFSNKLNERKIKATNYFRLQGDLIDKKESHLKFSNSPQLFDLCKTKVLVCEFMISSQCFP